MDAARRSCTGSCAPTLKAALRDPLQVLDWVNLYALAVSRDRTPRRRRPTTARPASAGGCTTTRFVPGATERGVIDFLLTVAARHPLQAERQHPGAEVGWGEVAWPARWPPARSP